MSQSAPATCRVPWLAVTSAFWLCLTAGLCWGWWRDHRALQAEPQRLLRIINRHEWQVQQVLGRIKPLPWSPGQAIGPPSPPETRGQGFWCASDKLTKSEWLQLDYYGNVRFNAVVIHQVRQPAQISRITVIDRSGHETEVWSRTQQDPPKLLDEYSPPYIEPRTIALNRPFLGKAVKLYFESALPLGQFGIDAAGVQLGDGEPIWASQATASSSHGNANWHAFIEHGSSFMQFDWYPWGGGGDSDF